jgi:endonuclease YncB( thermonuclease family)
MWKKRLKNLLWISLLLLLIGIQVWEESKHPPSSTLPSAKPTPSQSPSQKSPQKAKASTQTKGQASGGFETLIGGRLHEDRNNDGDSFKIFHDGKVMEFRLYFVDAPEKRLHQFNGERLDHQGRYFGKLTRDQTISIGQKAKAHTEQLLTSRPFRVVTRWQSVFESSRHYAFIFFEDTDEELSESLTRQGLARIYTEGTNLPDGRKKADFERHLKKIEAEAKQAKRGGWGLP